MEDLVKESEGLDIGLNIVVEANKKQKQKRKVHRYEKRNHQKKRRSEEWHEKNEQKNRGDSKPANNQGPIEDEVQKQSETYLSNDKEIDVSAPKKVEESDANVVSDLQSAYDETPTPITSNVKSNDANIVEDESVNEKSTHKLVEDNDDSSEQPTEVEDHVNDTSSQSHTMLKPSRTEARKKRDFLKNVEARAEYMAQYHARPMEMDRRSNAKSNIKKSTASNLIFQGITSNEKDSESQNSSPWAQMGLHKRLVHAIVHRGIITREDNSAPTPTIVQSDAIPKLLSPDSNGNVNVCVQCETGSGKTLAYLLPIIHSIAIKCEEGGLAKARAALGTQCIVVCPTRELATQVAITATNLLQHSFSYIVPGCLSGGEKRKAEKAKLRKGVTVLIATPGRLLDHLVKTDCLALSLKGKLSWLVLDEVDRLLDMGHKNQIQEIVERIRVTDQRIQRKNVNQLNTFNSVLVSATVTPSIESLAETILGRMNKYVWSNPQVRQQNSQISSPQVQEFSVAAPHQLSQLFMVVNAKLRLSALVAFLAARVDKKERVVVFMSTCDSVDFYYKLLTTIHQIYDEQDDTNEYGIFGSKATLLRLHGNIAHSERQSVLKQVTSSAPGKACILLATDVAARGLNLPKVDWIVQFDPPCEISDYVHRAGRAARAGSAGHALLFLLPSEREYVDILKEKGLDKLTALSLSATLSAASALQSNITKEGQIKTGQHNKSRSGEAFAAGIQDRCEQFVLQKMVEEAIVEKKRKREKQESELLLMARQAFASYIRAYPTKEKAVRHVFCARALHLGHVARSFGLKEPPSVAQRASRKTDMSMPAKKKQNSSLDFSKKPDPRIIKIVPKESSTTNGVDKGKVPDLAAKIKGNRLAMIDAAHRHARDVSEFT